MGTKKLLAAFVLPFLLVSFLQAQSLAELAKKEKERRAAIKGKATTITTADIAKVKKRPAVETAEQAQAEGEGQAGETGAQGLIEGAPPAGEAAPAAAEAAMAPAEKPAETVQPAETPASSDNEVQARTAELTKAVLDKQERVDLLTLKMNSLYQEFYSLDNMKSREMLQAQISDTYDKLLQAESDALKAEKSLEDFLTQVRKDRAPAIWIR